MSLADENINTPQYKVFPVESPVAGTEVENYNFVQRCATEYSAIPKATPHPRPEDLVNKLIFQFEEEEIIALQNPDSPSSQTLKATLTPIMERLQCNIFVAVGHTESCIAFLKRDTLQQVNSLPTIVLVVACFSNKKIIELNTKDSSIAKNFFFFGFFGFMHLLKGEIFCCVHNHSAVPFMDCRFDEVRHDLDVIAANVTQFNKPYAEQLDLLKCCTGRYEHFKQVFYNYMENRICSKYTTENLFAKLKNIRNAEGAVIRHTSTVNGVQIMTHEQSLNYIFAVADGTRCTDQGNCSAGKTNYDTYKPDLTVFDDRVKYGNRVTKQLFDILNKTSRYTPEEFIVKDNEMMTLLKGLPKETAITSLTREGSYLDESTGKRYNVPIFFFIFAENYKLSTQEILKSINVPLNIVLKGSFPLVTLILLHMSQRYRPTLTELEAYRLLRKIGDKNSNALTVGFKHPRTTTILFDGPTCYLSIIEGFFHEYVNATSKSDWIFIGRLSEKVELKEWTIQVASKVLEMFLSWGHITTTVEGSATRISVLQKYEEAMTQGVTIRVKTGRGSEERTVHLVHQSYKLQLEFLILLYVYLHNDSEFPEYSLENRITYWTRQLGSSTKYMQSKILRIVKVYQKAKDFFDGKGVSPESFRKGPEDELQDLIDTELEPIEILSSAIENVKTFFSKVQPNIQKRKDLSLEVKSEAIRQLVAKYKTVNSTKNEGENALRRLKEMHGFYSEFLTAHRKEGKTVPVVNSLRNLTKTHNLWLFQIIANYFAEVKAAKLANTRRRGKSKKLINTGALQRELDNIRTRLDSHNHGGIRLHHMTVKSLRKKKNIIEQQLRNLAPAANAPARPAGANAPARAAGANAPAGNAPAGNANNGNETEPENQAGGKRRTRKVRR